MSPGGERGRILVIKLGALGDFIQALGPMAAIRAHHLGAEIVLLTTAPFAGLAKASGYFDEVWIDDRAPLWRPDRLLALRRRLRQGGFARVYDLQTSDRTGWYFHLFDRRHRPEWSGIARGCSHRHSNPDRNRMHTLARQAEQLEIAGIDHVPPPEVDFLKADIRDLAVNAPFVLVVPGGAAHRPEKRWPQHHYRALAAAIDEAGLQPVLIGAAAEMSILRHVAEAVPGARNLAGLTSLAEIAELARQAHAAVGNDTGPMHLIAAVGCPSVVLFSDASDPALCAPRGRRVAVLHRPRIDDIEVTEVIEALSLPRFDSRET